MKNYYFGIDLGTTNSVISYANITNNETVKCLIVEVDRKIENGGRARGKILPSVVFYNKDPRTNEIIPEVGDYAKSRYGVRYGYVCKSVKSQMGKNEPLKLAEEIEDKTPSQVSAQILRTMLTSAKTRLFLDEITDAIITIPASFDSDQCQATLQAAKLAGIDVNNEHEILLYEPKAVIYDLVHMQELGEIPSDIIDFSTPKNVLVFDLGGGTLDVTIHKVGYINGTMMNIEDLAISRYTQIGGDNFDELIAKAMYKRFVNMYKLSIHDRRKEEVMSKLRTRAERVKIEMTDDYRHAEEMGKKLDNEYYYDISEINLYDSYSYSDELTIQELEEIIEPLMGGSLSLGDVKRIDSMKESEMNNIIYPILDVLAKAGSDVKIDAVILNGGMTRFFPIKKRIDKFFGLESLVTADPDLSVARGAVYYHYCLHKYNVTKSSEEEKPSKPVFMTGTILNDTVNLGVSGEYVSKLIEAGTKLPYCSEVIAEKYYLAKTSDSMIVEIFLGRGNTKNMPNRRIADRIVTFDRVYPAGTEISFIVSIDNLRMMKLEAFVSGHIETRTLMSIDTNKKNADKIKTKASKIITVENQVLNAKSELNNLKMLVHMSNKKEKYEFKMKVKQSFETIRRAENKRDFYWPIMNELSYLGLNDPYRGYLYAVAFELSDGFLKEERVALLYECKKHFSQMYYGFRNEASVLKEAIRYIAKWDQEGSTYLLNILQTGYFSYYEKSIYMAIFELAPFSKVTLNLFLSMKCSTVSTQVFEAVYFRLAENKELVNENVINYTVDSIQSCITSNDLTMLKTIIKGLAAIGSVDGLEEHCYLALKRTLQEVRHYGFDEEIILLAREAERQMKLSEKQLTKL
ncbi:MAG: Hsp70 family protein [bacterium]|nr:Hsp70 family protein [bacterium]